MMRTLTRLSPLPLAALLAACETPAEPTPESTPAVQLGPVVYGDDDRVEWYAHPDEEVRALARDSSVALVLFSRYSVDAEGNVTLSADQNLGERHGLCADQRFIDQPTVSRCSGTLIDDDLVLTAGHCIETQDDCARNLFVFDYLYEDDGALAPVTADAVYRCVDVIVQGDRDIPGRLDLAIVQLDRPVTGRVPARLAPLPPLPLTESDPPEAPRPPLQAGEPLLMVGYPSGLPMKIDDGGRVANPRLTQGNFFTASVDAFRGNSGSGVFDAARGLVGVLTDGEADYRRLQTCSIVNVLPMFQAGEGVHYAHHAITALCGRGFPSERLCGPTEAACGDGFCTADETPESCPDDCGGLFAIPETWTCNPAWYAVGDDCDCDCGAYDPDCEDTSLRIYNCAPNSECTTEGECTVRVPEGWTCRDSYYNAGDDCDCDCGAYDPDCDDTSLRTVNCRSGGVCQEDGTCTIGVPPEWTCERREWDRGTACDCNCGAWDPDCEDPNATVLGCAPGSACLPDGTCEEPFPEAWICGRQHYATGGRCDCNCGAPDPDCETSTDPPRNCQDGEVCDAGWCVEAPDPDPDLSPEPGPEPDPEVPADSADEDPEAVEPGPEPSPEPIADAAPEDAVPHDIIEEVAEPDPSPEVIDSSSETTGDDVILDTAEEVTPVEDTAEEVTPVEDTSAEPDAEAPDAGGTPAPHEEAGRRASGGSCAGGPEGAGALLWLLIPLLAVTRRRLR